jgi:hypothetical protein
MVAPQGYNITCDPGDLYSRKCYTTNSSGVKEEIIGYTNNGDPISKAQSSSSWIAWVPTLTTLNQDGTAYQPYGQAGIPYTKTGSAMGAYMPSSGADMQDYYYLNEVMPGSQARKMYNQRTCSPLWNTFGCKNDGSDISTAPNSEESAKNKSLFKKIFGSEAFTSQKWVPPVVGGVITLGVILAYKKLV